MHPIVWVALLAGGYLLYRQRQQRSLPEGAAPEPTTEPPANGNGNGAEGLPLPPPTQPQGPGFAFSDDCVHVAIYSPEATKDTLVSFYRELKLAGKLAGVHDEQKATVLTRAFFQKHYPAKCFDGDPKASIAADGQILPSQAPLSQQIMWAYFSAAFASILVNEGLWTQQLGSEYLQSVLAMVEASGFTASDWDEVFRGSVPIPTGFENGTLGGGNGTGQFGSAPSGA